MPAFRLEPRLSEGSVLVKTLALSQLRLSNHSSFPWVYLVPERADIVESFDLDPRDQTTLFDEITLVSRALKAATRCDKLNIGALGNVVSQFHFHIIARFRGDSAWPRAAWGTEVVPYAEAARDKMLASLRSHLPA